MASDNAYKKLAQLYNIMGTNMFHKHKIVAEILKDYAYIDYELPTTDLFTLKIPYLLNSTALELAAKKKDIDIFNILIEHGADFTRKNEQGQTVLHQMMDPKRYSKDRSYWQIEDAKVKNLLAESVLDAHVKLLNSTNPSDKHGLSHFHVACMLNHAKAIKFFLSSGVSPNHATNNDSTTFPGFTPLHMAVQFGAVETLNLLLQTDVKINAKNAMGMSALDLLMKDKIQIRLGLKWTMMSGIAPSFLVATDYRSIFFLNERMTNMILQKFDPKALVIDETTSLSRLHIDCTSMDHYALRTYMIGQNEILDFRHPVNATSPLWPGYTALHFAANYECLLFERLVDKGVADLAALDAKGETPFDIGLRNYDLRAIADILRQSDDWANVRFSGGKTSLLDCIVALQKPETFEAFLKDNFADVNTRIPEDSPLCRGYTPLHLAVAGCEWQQRPRFDETGGKRLCIDTCLRLGADVTAKNSEGSTPVHLAFHHRNPFVIKALLDGQTSADNPKDSKGLSHLHLASLGLCPSLAEKFPPGSDELDDPLEIGDFIWMKKSTPIRNGATPLSIALDLDDHLTAEVLLKKGAWMPVDEVERFAKSNLAERLLRRFPRDIEHVMRHCDASHVIVAMQNNAQLQDYLVERHGLTRLHVAVLIGEDIDQSTDDVNARVALDSPVWPGCTALHLLMHSRFDSSKRMSVARLLLDRGANATLKNARGATPVHDAFDRFRFGDHSHSSFIVALLSNSDVNPVDLRGISHFHVAAAVGEVDVVKGFLSNGVDVDGKIDDFSDKFAGYTALSLAVTFGRDGVVEILLEHGANVHCQTLLEDWPMHVAATADGSATEFESIMERLMRAGADIHAEKLFGETPLEKLLKWIKVTVEKVELFLQYDRQVKLVNSMSQEGYLAIALHLTNKSIYKSLINVYNPNVLDEFGRTAMHNIVSWERPSQNSLMEYRIIEQLSIKDYVKVIQELTSIGLDIDFQDTLGQTPLHLAAMYQNMNGIIALLNCGADINVNEREGYPPISVSMSQARKATPITRLNAQILRIFLMHIWKLRLFKLHVSDFNLRVDSDLHRQNSLTGPMIQSCRVEFQAMDKEKIGPIALRDFLCETGLVAAYPTMLYELRSSIDEYFTTNFDRLIVEFPELFCLLLLQYRKARKRMDMAESCAAALNYLVNFAFPRLCSDRVFRFLTYEDLKNLVASRQL